MATQVIPPPRKEQVLYVWPEQLKERKANNRFDYGNIDELGKSMLSHGIQLPLKTKKLKEKTDDGYPMYEVVDGNRRLRAANRIAAKMEEGDFVPIMIMADDITEADCIITALITGEHGKSRNMWEAALDIQALLKVGLKQTDIAKQIGKSPMFVSDCVLLYEKATPEIIANIKNGQITAYMAVEMLKETPAEEVEEAITKAGKKKKEKEESLIAAGKKGSTKKQLRRSEIEEEHGAPMTQKGKKKSTSAAESSKAQAGKEVNTPSIDATTAKLMQLRETMKANAGIRKENTFDMLNAIITYAKGGATVLDMLSLFFFEIDAEEDEDHLIKATPDYVNPKLAKTEAAPAPKKDDKKKAAPAPAAKPAKKAAGKKKAVEPDDDEEEIEEVEALDADDDDDDFLE